MWACRSRLLWLFSTGEGIYKHTSPTEVWRKEVWAHSANAGLVFGGRCLPPRGCCECHMTGQKRLKGTISSPLHKTQGSSITIVTCWPLPPYLNFNIRNLGAQSIVGQCGRSHSERESSTRQMKWHGEVAVKGPLDLAVPLLPREPALWLLGCVSQSPLLPHPRSFRSLKLKA